MQKALTALLLWGLGPEASAALEAHGCSERSGKDYHLKWRAQGRSFFDGFEFLTRDENHGAVEYLDRSAARAAGVAQAHPTHAIVGLGASLGNFKRQSAKIATRQTWKYFLAAVRYTKMPHGCGIWPAVWTHAPSAGWPDGGELDLLEYVNDLPSRVSFHTGHSNRCRLDAALLYKRGCTPMPDLNEMGYDCVTAYPDRLGCAPNKVPVWPGALWSQRHGVLAVEWTEGFVKVFRIPEGEIPEDLQADAPRPDSWGRWLIAYFPFAASERRSPGSCPDPANVMAPQQLVFNIGLCGDWASKVWKDSHSCVNVVGPRYPEQCRSTDPLRERSDPETDCCTQFVSDPEGRYGAEQYFARQGYFNITSVKVYQ
mmetsp:Transcript_52221/g.154132  ORF Transcript_52221/g.154132 Transcript_52221/m.154132 type:complete len:370 (+) Transcript_52221:61-1170(+)